MTRDELAARLLQTFLDELEEQVRVLNAELLVLEREPAPDPSRLDAVFRVAHTLKGAARAARLTPIEELCHAMEVPLGEARAAGRPLDRATFALLFAAADALGDAERRLRDGGALDVAALGTLARRFTALALDGAGAADPRAPEPRASGPALSGAAVRTGAARRPAPDDAAPDDAAPDDAAPDDAEPAAPVAVRAETQVRVRAEKLDELVAAAGELMLATGSVDQLRTETADLARQVLAVAGRARTTAARLRRGFERAGLGEGERHALETLVRELGSLVEAAQGTEVAGQRAATAVGRAGAELVDSVRRLRLRPFAEAVEALPRVVRDLAREMDKDVELVLEGMDVEADRSVLDGLREAMLHLVRNAVDHGIEAPDERAARGKPARGRITVGAALVGQTLRVTVADDGAGVDLAAIRGRAEALGRPVPAQLAAVARLLFESGFSTRTTATEISGRGVGLDVVRSAVERLRGSVDVRWVPGAGTTFVLETPLTLATQRALLVEVSGQPIAIPTMSIAQLRRAPAESLRQVDGRTVLPGADGAVPLVPLARLLGAPLRPPELVGQVPIVVVGRGDQRLGLLVDALLEELELVVRPIDRATARTLPALGGAALLPSGRIALVVAPAALLASPPVPGGDASADAGAPPAPAPAARILVVDDSITTRTLERSVLESAGYEVATAVDGVAGWTLLQERGADLVLTDVEMPRMDGYALCETIRGDRRFDRLPIVLVTSLESEEQRRRGLEAGADAYIVKSSFDQEELLDTVRQLLGRGGGA